MMFSAIDFIEKGHERLLEILKSYDMALNEDEVTTLKYGHLGHNYSPGYIPRVSRNDQQRFREMMDTECSYFIQYGANKKGKVVKKRIPTSYFNPPDKIVLKFNENEYEFENDDCVKQIFHGFLQQLFNDYKAGKIELIEHKEHDWKKLVVPLLEYIDSLIAAHQSQLSRNRTLHLVYDIIALAYPWRFSVPNYEELQDENRYKATRIKDIIE